MPVAELQNVTKNYGTVNALRGVSLAIERGELVAVLGPNGAGKTTAVRILLGLTAQTSGRAAIFGHAPGSHEAKLRRGAMLQVARVPETIRVCEHIELFSSYYPKPLKFAETIAAAGLGGVERRLFGDLSGGQKQRVLFALAICGNPDMLFLDEPTVGLDVAARRGLWKHIREYVARGGSVLLTTHYLEEADALANRIAVIDEGRIVAEGTPAEIKRLGAASASAGAGAGSGELEDAFLSLVGQGRKTAGTAGLRPAGKLKHAPPKASQQNGDSIEEVLQ